MKSKKVIYYRILPVSFVLIGLLLMGLAYANRERTPSTQASQSLDSLEVVISPEFPVDIFSDGTPAHEATLTEASVFAWREFVALNWAALAGTRGVHDPNARFGEPNSPVVWQTNRSKVELFPGRGNPVGYETGAPDYGYAQMPPAYNYRDSIAACDAAQQANIPPMINLDERGQIFQDTLHAGVYGPGMGTDNQVLYTSKGNDVQYIYLAANQIYINGNNPNNANSPNAGLFENTSDYVLRFNESPPAATDPGKHKLFSFPSGIVENKAGWRRLTPEEVTSGRFFTTIVRYYERDAEGNICFRDSNMEDDVWGLISLHIIHKTPTAPYFTFATFSHADNILDPEGNPVEDENGNIYPQYQDLPPLEPHIETTMAYITEEGEFVPQSFTPMTADCTQDDKRLRYMNTTEVTTYRDEWGNGKQVYPFATTQGVTCINRPIHPTPAAVIEVNTAFHEAIAAYNEANGLTDSPWLYYRLVNIQWQPLEKAPGVVYTDDNTATYYLTNPVVESNYNLQMFSGTTQFDYPLDVPFLGLATDYAPLGTGINPPIYNVRFAGRVYNMGGCMGCHGLVQRDGQDFSFMTQGGPVCEPEVAGDPEIFGPCVPVP